MRATTTPCGCAPAVKVARSCSSRYQRLTIEDSVISAPICVRTPGSVGLSLLNNTVDCDLGVQFETSVLIGNSFIDNRIRGQMQNIEF